MRLCSLLCGAALALCLPLRAAEPMVSLLVELEGPSISEFHLPARPAAGLAARANGLRRRTEIRAQHEAVAKAAEDLGAQVTGRFGNVVNAVRLRVPASRVAEVSRLPGVTRVQRTRHYQRQLTGSVPWIGTPRLWSKSGGGYAGQGVRIGVIDSGIDYLHADFGGSGDIATYDANDPTVIEPGTFPTAKVVGGTDLVGDDYDSSDPFHDSPAPDPDPLDPRANGHGSHVAGIAAGLGVNTDGTPYTGSYDGVDFARFKVGPGVAPKASLYAIKVFGSTGSTDAIVDALDWAADPDGDGDPSDHLDVVVLSLGGAFGFDDADDVELKAVERLAGLGCVLAISAGNEGNTSYILSAPGCATSSICVADSYDDATGDRAIRVDAPSELAGNYFAEEGGFPAQLADLGTISGSLVATEPANACADLTNAADLKGKIALIDRAPCFFVDKIRRAQAAGAVAVVMANNVDTPATVTMGGSDATDITIPSVMISKADATKLRTRLAAGVQVTLAANLQVLHPERADTLEAFSSRGPVPRSHRLKPDVAAPGASIVSAKAGGGGSGIVESGTSMSAPHVAGAAALLRQAHPTWPAEDIKAALMNTAVTTRDASGAAYPESRTGAGRIAVDHALATPVIAKADGRGAEVSVSFGALEVSSAFATNRAIRLVNHGTTPLTLAVAVSNTVIASGVAVTPASASVTVPAQGETTLGLHLAIDPALLSIPRDPTSTNLLDGFPRQQLPESSGEVWFSGGTNAIHVPWYVVAKAAATHHVTATRIGAPTGAVATLSLPTRGTGFHPNPLVSVFQLGATNRIQGFTDGRADGDIRAIGVASDYTSFHSITNTTLYFGLAVAGRWFTPQRSFLYCDIEIDLNGNGRAEYAILNSDTGGFAAGDPSDYSVATDGLITVVENQSSGELISEWPINRLEDPARDTAPYLNSVMVYAVQASDIGLTDASPTFRYRLLTDAAYPDGTYSDETSWISFNPTKPILDATPYGLDQSPIFDEGRGVRLDVHRENAGAVGTTRALVLHQHNQAGTQVEVVTLDLSSTDSDGDGLPDAWELEHFGDLSYGPDDDPDGDGVTNAQALASGTSPMAIHLAAVGTPDPSLQWSSPAGRLYTVERAGNPAGPFTVVQSHLTANAGLNTYHDPGLAGDHPAYFYRLRVE